MGAALRWTWIRLATALVLDQAPRVPAGISQRIGVMDSSDPKAAEDLLPLVYQELRRMAAQRLAGEQRQHTLQPTALVHEAWLRMCGSEQRQWNDRQHFFASAVEAMRRILVDAARRRLAAKRGGGADRVDADELEMAAPAPDEQLLVVNEALEKFARVDARKAELVKLRYFAGMSFEDAATTLGIAVPTAKQWWAYARAWLRVEMARANQEAQPAARSREQLME
ncbi:MAG: sigma-70 family RNA polymerase sigma factor [Verrucomicrobiales bacterium]|nr:sigma-70 family RNA polymerase sigma factor [Verrucomicrobiales bacterium]